MYLYLFESWQGHYIIMVGEKGIKDIIPHHDKGTAQGNPNLMIKCKEFLEESVLKQPTIQIVNEKRSSTQNILSRFACIATFCLALYFLDIQPSRRV